MQLQHVLLYVCFYPYSYLRSTIITNPWWFLISCCCCNCITLLLLHNCSYTSVYTSNNLKNNKWGKYPTGHSHNICYNAIEQVENHCILVSAWMLDAIIHKSNETIFNPITIIKNRKHACTSYFNHLWYGCWCYCYIQKVEV